jgi:hypothetical protein
MNGGLEAKSGAKAEPDTAAAAADDSDSDVVCVEEDEGDTAHSGYSGFYRASRETGRANVLLALQVSEPCLTATFGCGREWLLPLLKICIGCKNLYFECGLWAVLCIYIQEIKSGDIKQEQWCGNCDYTMRTRVSRGTIY